MSKAAITNPNSVEGIAPVASFDQVVEGNIDIKQLSKKKYKITFNKIDKFLKYQTWSDTSKTLNENRSVYYQNSKQWIQRFNSLNASLKVSDKPLFRPSTVMKICSKKYLFVIYEAKLNNKDRVVFKVSTEEIKLSPGTSKKLLKLPHGRHDGARFDIDDIPDTPPVYILSIPANTGISSCPTPSGNVVITIAIDNDDKDKVTDVYVLVTINVLTKTEADQIQVISIFGIWITPVYYYSTLDGIWYYYKIRNFYPKFNMIPIKKIISSSNKNQYYKFTQTVGSMQYDNYQICGDVSFISY